MNKYDLLNFLADFLISVGSPNIVKVNVLAFFSNLRSNFVLLCDIEKFYFLFISLELNHDLYTGLRKEIQVCFGAEYIISIIQNCSTIL